MSDGEPAVLRGDQAVAVEAARTSAGARAASPPVARVMRDARVVRVVGFWRRAAAAVIDLAIVVPAAIVITLIASKLAGIALPRLHLTDIDLWIDLVLATDPALLMGAGLAIAIGMIYLVVFHIALGRTLGMRALGIKVIDVYGDPPSPRRCLARCAAYLASVATLGLGFLWIGFDSEKRGLQDWIAGTYVIRA